MFTLLIPVDASFVQYQIMWLWFGFGPLSVTFMVTDSTSLPSLCSGGWEICSMIWGSWIGNYNITLNNLAVFTDLDLFTNSPLKSMTMCENVNAFIPFFFYFHFKISPEPADLSISLKAFILVVHSHFPSWFWKLFFYPTNPRECQCSSGIYWIL